MESQSVSKNSDKQVASFAAGAGAIGALAVGAVAFGALALGAVAIGRLVIGGLQRVAKSGNGQGISITERLVAQTGLRCGCQLRQRQRHVVATRCR